VFNHEALRGPVRGCRLLITGSFQSSPSGKDVASRLRDGLAAQEWQEMPAYSADGKGGTAFALRKREVACLFRAICSGGSDGEPTKPLEHAHRVSVLCTSPVPPEERTRKSQLPAGKAFRPRFGSLLASILAGWATSGSSVVGS
jgi:hypothetical protein